MSSKLLVTAIVIIVIATGGFWFATRETPDSATAALSSQGIDLNGDAFNVEIGKLHLDNIRHFITLGASAGTQDKNGVSALTAAIDTGNEKVISAIVSTLPSNAGDLAKMVNLQDKDGRTALIAASEHNDMPVIQKLLAEGADVSLTDHALVTPLIAAIKHKASPALVQALIRAEQTQHNTAISVQSADATGDMPLFYAIRSGDPGTVKTLIDAKADVKAGDLRGTTPLMVAAETGNVPIAEELMTAGATPDVSDRFGSTALIAAIRNHHPDFVHFLIDKGADPDYHTKEKLPIQVAIETEPFDFNLFSYLLARSKQVESVGAPLVFDAIDHKNAELVNALLERGLNPKFTNAKGETLLYHAIEAGNEDTAIAIIDKGGDINTTGIAGITPIASATERNEIKVANKLLALGVSPEQKTAEGYTIAEMAVYRGYPEILEALLNKGAKIQKDFSILWSIRDGGGRAVPVLLNHNANANVMSENGETALWLASSMGEAQAVQAFIDHHAAIDYPNKAQGMTPLAIAAHAGQLEAVKLLVTAGAKVDAVDNYGMTPLAHAAYMTKPDVVELLIAKGANVNATDRQNRTIADLASRATPSAARDKVMLLLNRK